jgi:outer membrane protein assembly factor BamB
LGLQLSDGSREFLSRLPGATEQDYNDLRFYPADDRLFYSVNYETDSLNGRGTEFGALSLPDLSQLWQNRAVDQSGEIEVCGGVKDPDASYVFVTRINTTVTERVEEGREPAVEAYDLESGRQQWHVDIHGLPLAAHNGRLYVGLPRYDLVTSRGLNGIAALEIDTGEEIWRRDDPSLIMNTIATGNSMAVDDSGVYLALEHSLMSLDPTDGSTQWQYQTTEPIVTTPVAAGNAVVVGSQPRLHTVSKSDGSQLSISRIQGEAAGRGITGSIAVAGRAVFAGTDRGIVAFA